MSIDFHTYIANPALVSYDMEAVAVWVDAALNNHKNRLLKDTNTRMWVLFPTSRTGRVFDRKKIGQSPRRFIKHFKALFGEVVDYWNGGAPGKGRALGARMTWQELKFVKELCKQNLKAATPERRKELVAVLKKYSADVGGDVAATSESSHHSNVRTSSNLFVSRCLDGISSNDVLAVFDAGFVEVAVRLAPLIDRKLPLRRTPCREIGPFVDLPKEIKAVLHRNRLNYDMGQAHLIAAKVPEHLLPDYAALASSLGCTRDAVKMYANRLIEGCEPRANRYDSWTRAHGDGLRSLLQLHLAHLRPFALPASVLMRRVRDFIGHLIDLCRSSGILVASHEHDGIVVDRPIPRRLVDEALGVAGLPAHCRFDVKPFT